MFCRKCGEVIADGEELCQACSGKHKIVDWFALKKVAQETGEKVGEIGQDIMSASMKEVEKAVKKKANQTTNKVLVKMGLKKKSPLDKAKNMWKKMKK